MNNILCDTLHTQYKFRSTSMWPKTKFHLIVPKQREIMFSLLKVLVNRRNGGENDIIIIYLR